MTLSFKEGKVKRGYNANKHGEASPLPWFYLKKSRCCHSVLGFVPVQESTPLFQGITNAWIPMDCHTCFCEPDQGHRRKAKPLLAFRRKGHLCIMLQQLNNRICSHCSYWHCSIPATHCFLSKHLGTDHSLTWLLWPERKHLLVYGICT